MMRKPFLDANLKPNVLRSIGLTLVMVVSTSFFTVGNHLSGPAILLIQAKGPYVDGEVMVRFKDGVSQAEAEAVLFKNGMEIIDASRVLKGFFHVKLPAGMSVDEAIVLLSSDPRVQYAEPNFFLEPTSHNDSSVPNDPDFPQQWGLAKIDAEKTWDIIQGNSNVVVAILDTGIQYTHPDLGANIWTNPNETAGNSIDDDGNGYVDDVHGMNIVGGNANPDPMDDDDTTAQGHGTRLAGIIGAVTNDEEGIAGINWNVRLMAVKIRSNPGRSSDVGKAMAGLSYVAIMKDAGVNIRVAVLAWTTCDVQEPQGLKDAIQALADRDILLIASGRAPAAGCDVVYPADHDLWNIIAMTSIDSDNQLGPTAPEDSIFVDLGAPGEDIYSTMLTDSYGFHSGVSYADPHMAGAVALLAAWDSSLTANQIKMRLLSSTIMTPSLLGKTSTGGRLNLWNAISAPITDMKPLNYQLSRLEANDLYYLDRSFQVQAVPAGFDGLWWVRSKNDDKTNADAGFIQLGLGQESVVYVVYNTNATTVPDWLGPDQDWTDTGREITVTDPVGTLRIYTKPFGPGTAVLGGNQAAGYVGPADASNYVVLIRTSAGNGDTTGISAHRLDGYDLIGFNLAMGSSDGSQSWCAACDLDGSGTIDATDRGLFMDNFGKSL